IYARITDEKVSYTFAGRSAHLALLSTATRGAFGPRECCWNAAYQNRAAKARATALFGDWRNGSRIATIAAVSSGACRWPDSAGPAQTTSKGRYSVMQKQVLLPAFLPICLPAVGGCPLPAATTTSGTPGAPGSLASANVTPNDPTFHGCPAG